MWQDRDRWRLRFRVVIFVLAASALVTAWLMHAGDAFSVPTVLLPIDGWLGITPQPHTGPALSTAAPASTGSSQSARETGTGTPGTPRTGGTAGGVGTSGPNHGASPDRPVTTVTFGPQAVTQQEPSKHRRSEDTDATREVPCEPRHDGQAESIDTQGAREGTPCETGPSRGRDAREQNAAVR